MSEVLYAIIKENKELRLVTKTIEYHYYTNSELCNFFNYARDMSCAYSSCLPAIKEDEVNFSERSVRNAAADMKKAIEEIKGQDVIAYSHRFGGWNSVDWNFGKRISFHIFTNFGYGCVSEFRATYKYKDIVLAPYSYYVKYKYSNYGTVVRCTHEYPLKYDSWYNLMNDCINFYNALVHNKTHYIFNWLNKELTMMVAGLEEFLHCDSYNFAEERNNVKACNYTNISDNDFWIIKSTKIAHSIEFIDNIKSLPKQIDTQPYIDKIVHICKKFRPLLSKKISETKKEIGITDELLRNLEGEEYYILYDKFYSKYYKQKKWYLSSYKIGMIKFLMRFYKRFFPHDNINDIKTKVEKLNNLIKHIEDLRMEHNKLVFFLWKLEENLSTMKKYLKQVENHKPICLYS